jgi:methionyl aminopeptidase
MGDEVPAAKRRCLGIDCGNDAGALQCPTCQKMGKESFFCSQDCFKKSWVSLTLLLRLMARIY